MRVGPGPPGPDAAVLRRVSPTARCTWPPARPDGTRVDEPAGRTLERLGRRARGVTELGAGPGVVERHVGRRHPAPPRGARRVRGRAGGPPPAPRRPGGQGQGGREPAGGGGEPGDLGQRGEHSRSARFSPPEDVAAPGPPPLGGEDVPGGHVLDVHDVEGGVDVPRDPALEELEHGGPVGVGPSLVGPPAWWAAPAPRAGPRRPPGAPRARPRTSTACTARTGGRPRRRSARRPARRWWPRAARASPPSRCRPPGGVVAARPSRTCRVPPR